MPRDAAHGRRACQPRRELQDKGCSRSAALVSLRRGGGGGVTFSACASATPPVRSRPRTRRPAPPPTCMRRCRRLHVAPPHPSYPRARSDCVHRRVHWGGEVPAPKRGDAGGRRRWRGAHVPVEPWRDTHHAHLCDEGRVSILLHAVEYSVPNMNGECNAPRQSCTRERGNNVSRPGAASCVSHSRSSALRARIGPLPRPQSSIFLEIGVASAVHIAIRYECKPRLSGRRDAKSQWRG